jgi:hypothetical protein
MDVVFFPAGAVKVLVVHTTHTLHMVPISTSYCDNELEEGEISAQMIVMRIDLSRAIPIIRVAPHPAHDTYQVIRETLFTNSVPASMPGRDYSTKAVPWWQRSETIQVVLEILEQRRRNKCRCQQGNQEDRNNEGALLLAMISPRRLYVNIMDLSCR